MIKKLFLLTIFSISLTAYSQTVHNWVSGAPAGNWNDAAHWTSGLPSGSEQLTFNNNNQLTMTNDLVATNRYRIHFNSNATSSRTMTGTTTNNFYNFGGADPRVYNNSAAVHTIDFPINLPDLDDPFVIAATVPGAGLIFDNTIINGYEMWIAQSGDSGNTITFNGVISGAGNFDIGRGLGGGAEQIVVFNAANTYTGFTIVRDGVLKVNADMASGIQLLTDAHLEINAHVTIPYLTLNATTPTVIIKSGASLTITGNLTNYSTSLDSIILEDGASLIVQGSALGFSTDKLTYKLDVDDTNWHLLASPVLNEWYNDTWVSDNEIDDDGDGTNFAIAVYVNTTDADGNWVYKTDGTDEGFLEAKGYSVKRDATPDNIEFKGKFHASDISLPITIANGGTANENPWNLTGNTYTSYIDINGMLDDNLADLDDEREAVYVWNGTSYTGIASGNLHPGQGFFVASALTSTTFNINKSRQTTSTGALYKSSQSVVSIDLMLGDGTITKVTKINYIDGKTTGLDPRFDIGAFSGQSSSFGIYTHLVSNSKGTNFERQALPKNYENLVIPVDVKADAGKEITFTVEALNLPTGIKVYLEDRNTNVFTRLDEVNSKYTITIDETKNGIGQFYLHTKSSALSTSDVSLENISIYKSGASTLKITGLSEGKSDVKLFNIFGKQVFTTSFNSNGVQNISLPKLATGMYIVQVATEKGKSIKKIILE